MRPTILYIFSGLPGVGKTTLSKSLASRVGATYLRIDTLEQALRDQCQITVEGQGYELAYRIATDNLELGRSVVADSCNPIELTRTAWENIASSAGAGYRNIEIICSDIDEHRHRVERRKPTIQNHTPPDWDAVVKRKYDLWNRDRILIDTAGRSPDESLSEVVDALKTSAG